MHARKLFVLITFATLAAGTSAFAVARDDGRTHASRDASRHVSAHVLRGKISWYGPRFAGRKTASGERFDPGALTMAHRWLPLGTIVLVINDDNGRSVALRVNDRGPYCDGRVADVSRAASQRLGFVHAGIADATLEVLWMPSRDDSDV
jgi:rare lipoprotein A